MASSSAMEQVTRELGLLFRGLKGLHSAAAASVGLRVEMPAATVLVTLDERGRLRLSALAEVLHLDLSSVSRQVAALERDGWVSRTRDPQDQRAALLELTPDGRDVLRRLREARVAQLRRLLPDWSDVDLADFAAALSRFRTDLTAGASAAADPPAAAAAPAHGPAPARTRTTDVPALAGLENR